MIRNSVKNWRRNLEGSRTLVCKDGWGTFRPHEFRNHCTILEALSKLKQQAGCWHGAILPWHPTPSLLLPTTISLPAKLTDRWQKPDRHEPSRRKESHLKWALCLLTQTRGPRHRCSLYWAVCMSVHKNKRVREEVHNGHFGRGAEPWHWISRTERGETGG